MVGALGVIKGFSWSWTHRKPNHGKSEMIPELYRSKIARSFPQYSRCRSPSTCRRPWCFRTSTPKTFFARQQRSKRHNGGSEGGGSRVPVKGTPFETATEFPMQGIKWCETVSEVKTVVGLKMWYENYNKQRYGSLVSLTSYNGVQQDFFHAHVSWKARIFFEKADFFPYFVAQNIPKHRQGQGGDGG